MIARAQLDENELRSIKRALDRLYAHLVTRRAYPNERVAKLCHELVGNGDGDVPSTPRSAARSLSMARDGPPLEETDELVGSESWDSVLMQRLGRQEADLVMRMPPPPVRVATPSLREGTPSVKRGRQEAVQRARVEAQSRLPLDDSVEHPSRRLKRVFLPSLPAPTNGANGNVGGGATKKIFAKPKQIQEVAVVDLAMETTTNIPDGAFATRRTPQNKARAKSDEEEEQPVHHSHKRRRIESPVDNKEEVTVAWELESEEDLDDQDILDAHSQNAADLVDDEEGFELEWAEESRQPKRMRMKPGGAPQTGTKEDVVRAAIVTPKRSTSPSDPMAAVRWSSRTRDAQPVYAFTRHGFPKRLATSTPRAHVPSAAKPKLLSALGQAASLQRGQPPSRRPSAPKPHPPASSHNARPAPKRTPPPAASQKTVPPSSLATTPAARPRPDASPRSHMDAERISANAGTVIFHRRACYPLRTLPHVDLDNLWAVHWQLAREPAATRKAQTPFLYRNMRAQGRADRRLRWTGSHRMPVLERRVDASPGELASYASARAQTDITPWASVPWQR